MEQKETNITNPQKETKKKNNKVLLWILGGCLALLVISGIIVGGIAYWGYKKIKNEIKANQPNFEKYQANMKNINNQASEQLETPPTQMDTEQNYTEDPADLQNQGDSVALPENSERQMGYIKKVYAKNGMNYLDVDYIQWLTGSAAEQAMREDGECQKTGECIVYDDYYIRNVNPLIRTFEIAPEAKITMETYEAEKTGIVNNNQEITFAQFKGIFAPGSQSLPKDVPYIVEIANKKIISITEQYVP
jgi:hypothetical protein